MDVRYAPGDGVLIGAAERWLLVRSPRLDEAVVEELWALLSRPDSSSGTIVALVEERCGADASLVLVDLTAGAEDLLSRGEGRLTTVGGVHLLRVGDGPAPFRRLVAGTVAAGAADLRPEPTRGSPALIDGIPPEILAAVAPPPTPPATLQPPVETDAPPDESQRRFLDRMGRTVRRRGPGAPDGTVVDPDPDPDPDPDHDGQTSHRPDLLGSSGTPAPPASQVDHLQQPTHETVLAVHCPHGHVTAAYTPICRVCAEPVAPQEPHRVPRPRLGVLHLPDGERVPLDRGVVLGRQPAAASGGEAWPHLVRLPSGSTYVSRTHLQLELDGWLVLATDLGSRAGTTLRVPGRAAVRIRAHERYVWEPGQVLDLADSYEIYYEVTS